MIILTRRLPNDWRYLRTTSSTDHSFPDPTTEKVVHDGRQGFTLGKGALFSDWLNRRYLRIRGPKP
jgi:hypothetical protein